MEWREQSTVSCQDAYVEARRWIEAVTKKTFKGRDFRSALENGILLCDVINKIKPGIIKRVNRLPTPIAGLDNINVFLKACLKLGLKEAQLFHPGDLQDLSSRVTVNDEETDRRLTNVLITLYWLGRRAQGERSYDGPYLNFKAFEGLLGTALHKALQELSGQKGNSVQDSDLGDNWYSEREELHQLRGSEESGGGHRRDDSLDSLDSLGSQPLSISSDATLKGSSEGCCSDAEADAAFRMADNKESLTYRRSVSLTPKVTTQFNQFLPTKDKATGYVPAPLRKKRAERNDDSRRSWANPAHGEEDDFPITRSKSTSDISEEPVLVRRRSQYEALEKYREQTKMGDDKWQDDLSKWKNRRNSVNSDIVRKKEDREKVEQITSGGSTRTSKTYKEMQDDRENRRSGSIGSRIGLLSFDDDSDVFEKPKPRTRDSLSRSYTVDTLYHSSGSSEAAQRKEDNPPDVPLRSTKPEADAANAPGGTATRSSFHRPKPSETASSLRSSVFDSTAKTEESSPPSRASQKVSEPKNPVKVQPPSSSSLYKPLARKTETNAAAVSRISASLPRSYQRSDSMRLSSVVTPRPFGTQPSRLGSLTRTLTSDDSNSRVNGSVAVSKNPPVPSRYRQFMTAEDEARSRSSPAHSSEDDDDEQQETTGKSATSASGISSHPVHVKREVSAKEPHEESSCEMRISLNQKPNSSRDFGFDVAWDSGVAHVKSIQAGSPAETFQLQAGDEVLTVNGHRVADMSYLDWKASMDRALREGSVVMDIRRHGKSSFPDAGSANTLDFTSLTDTSAKLATHSVVDLASNGVDGGFPKVSMMTAESEPISMINLKRRSEFFEKGGADSAMPNILVPPITTSSTRWSWDPEEERRRQEKWQREQERQLQEKYKRDQEKLQEEWTKAQQEISSSVRQAEPVGPSFASRELERQRERLEQERKRREEEEQERSKLEVERKRAEEVFERQRQEMRRREEELERERQEVERMRREQEKELERQMQEMRRREEELERQKQQEREREEERRKREVEEERQRQEEEERRRRNREEEERRKREVEEERQRQEEEERRRRNREDEEEEERRKREEERRKREVEEDRQRQEEEERRRRNREEEEEEERRQREEEEEEEEERRQREEEEEEEEERRQREEEEELLWQRRREAEKEELRRRLAAAEERQRRERELAVEGQRAKSLEEEETLQSRASVNATRAPAAVVGAFAHRGGMARWLLEEQARSARDKVAHGQKAASELETERRNILNAMRYRQPERATGSDVTDAKGPQPTSQAELQRQQLLNDMKKKTNLLTDSSWIRPRSATAPGQEDPPSTRRGVSLDRPDNLHDSWRSSWTPGSYFRPLSASAPFHGGGRSGSTFRGPAAETTPWSRRSSSPSLSPTASPEPGSDAGGRQQRSRSVSGKKVCTLCHTALGKGAAMIIESLGLCYHLTCFKCIDCKSALGGSEAGAEVRIRNKQLYCNSCYVRFKTGQPTSM
ncbi:LIM domain only protein 7 isoform X3 [Phyllopteryx taeniolatus]|uniref:LIM domain only protein 7 isoform X3 n=1 Tax=Phyllopteryx taeniolatus TaxID=161469 RepID=UPI002AD23C52|nr:LIM domain only protein 7 isoform X3 [Phyllopteryx taeniolatus]